MASADLNAVLAEYNGTNLQQLIKKYNLKNDDIAKLRQLNAKIDKELGVKDGAQPLPNSTEITLDDGTKVLAAQVRTVNQPKGGKVNVYMDQDGKHYYQYVDANGKQQKITKTWDYFSATGDNMEVAWNKLQDGHPWDALMTLMEGAEDPRELNAGIAPAVGFAKGGGFIKSMKDIGKWLKQLKNIKSFEQFKSFAMSLIKSTPKGATIQEETRTLSNGVNYQAKFCKTNKPLITKSGKTIPAGAKIEPHANTLGASGVNNNGELLLDVYVDGKPEVIVLKGGGFHSQTWTMKSLNHNAGDNYYELVSHIAKFINVSH